MVKELRECEKLNKFEFKATLAIEQMVKEKIKNILSNVEEV